MFCEECGKEIGETERFCYAFIMNGKFNQKGRFMYVRFSY